VRELHGSRRRADAEANRPERSIRDRLVKRSNAARSPRQLIEGEAAERALLIPAPIRRFAPPVVGR
jgi:hypothetical protein